MSGAEHRPAGGVRSGFTLLELLVALTILVTAFAIVWSSFSATVTAWRRGGQLLDELRHGDFVMEQLVSALRSAVFFPESASKCGFRLSTKGGPYRADSMSWVTSSSAFIPPDSPTGIGLHRIVFGFGNNEDGDYGVSISAYPYLADEEKIRIEEWFVSTEVKGLRCRVYDPETETWGNIWEDTNAVPSLVEITLYMDPIEKYGEPVTLTRLVEIPIAPAVTNAVAAPGEGGGEGEGEGAAEQGSGEAAAEGGAGRGTEEGGAGESADRPKTTIRAGQAK